MTHRIQFTLLETPHVIHSIPGDKSISHRAIILGSLATNTSRFCRFLFSEDCLNTIAIFKHCGVPIDIHQDTQTITITGVGLHGLTPPLAPLDVGNSGTGIRLITGVLAGQSFSSVITGDRSIQQRPMKRIIDPLQAMGALISGIPSKQTADICPPLTIQPATHLNGIHYTLPIASAQVKSAILLASLYAKDTTLITEPSPCRNHTEIILKSFGAHIHTRDSTIHCNGSQLLRNPFDHPITIPADFSSAAFFIVLGLIHPHCTFTITHVGMNPTRNTLLHILQKMGGDIHIHHRVNDIEPYADITVSSSTLTNYSINVVDIPFIIDEIPILAVAAMCSTGTLTITGASELRHKESDRIHSTVQLITQFGGSIKDTDDGFICHGGASPQSPTITTYDDHRIAMSAIIASVALRCPVELDSIDCIRTSFPNFLEILQSISHSGSSAPNFLEST